MSDSFDLQRTIDAVLGGQRDAFLGIMREYGPSMRVFLGTQLFHIEELDDLAQEVFIAAYRGLPTFERDADFGRWLRGIARNKLYHYFERTKRRKSALEIFRSEVSALLDGELERSAACTDESQVQALLQCITKLPERMKVVVRNWLDGQKVAALVDELKLSAANIYQIQHRATQQLRKCIERETTHAK